MQRACFLLRVKPERLDEYLHAHDPVWPEMLAVMREAGIRSYAMFFRPDGLLVGYLEGEDIPASLRQVAATEVNARWQQRMAPFFEGGSGDLQSGGPEWLTEYFYLE